MTGFKLEDTDWMKRRLPPYLRDKTALLAYLKANGLTVESFKQTTLYKANVATVDWLKTL